MAVAVFPKHEMRYMLRSKGDVRYEWDQDDPAQVELARKAFEKAMKKGFKAFRMDAKEQQEGESLKEFDPTAEKIFLVPQLVGG